MHLSHDLPVYRSAYPGYSDNLRRVAAAVHEKHPHTVAIDVGANIGDSVVFLRRAGYELIIAVEPAPEFTGLLRENMSELGGIVIEEVMLAGSVGHVDGEILTRRGTGHLVAGITSTPTTTIDALAAAHADLGPVSLIKTDTDGLDLEILRGAEKTLAARPTVFFEHDPRRFAMPRAAWLDFVGWLGERGYGPILVFDRLGDLLTSADARDPRVLEELDSYARTTGSEYFYFDMAAFPSDDSDVADTVRARELRRVEGGGRT